MKLVTTVACLLVLFVNTQSQGADDPVTPALESNSDAQRALLDEGMDIEKAGNPRRAITDYFDAVIDDYEATYKDSGKTFYSAQNPLQMILYAALPQTDKRETVVVDALWADAYLMKAYALTDLGELDAARTALQAAIALSPMNSQYLAELAYTYIADRNWDKSIETYRQAADVAELGSSDETKNHDLARAWRGEGYNLVELGKLDEAAALYQKCLKLDAKDDKARGELRYIEGLRKK